MDASLLILEIVLLVGALGVMLYDLVLPADRKDNLWALACMVPVAVLGLSFLPHLTDAAANGGTSTLADSFMVDTFSLFMKRAFAVTALLVLMMSREYVKALPRGQGEFYTLTLLAAFGMFCVSSVNDFMSMFVSLEVVTVSFFVLAAFKRDKQESVEAGIKLLVIGSLSAAILLYGIAFVYGATGTVSFTGIRTAMANGSGVPMELVLGAVMVFIGLGFKISAVPLHVWVPDVYTGAPTPTTAYLSVGSKLAGFVLVIRCWQVFSSAGALLEELVPFFALIAALTLFYGNLGALPQTNLKRLMGYSSIGQCGYLLLGIAASSQLGLSGVLFYMSAYVLMNLLAFAVIMAVSKVVGSHEIDDYAGLGKRSPLLALALTTALLSLAGVPPFMGFFGKFMLVGSVFAHPELRWLGVVGLINVVIAMYYYLCVVKRIYVHEPRMTTTPVIPLRMRIILTASIVAIMALGIRPQIIENSTTEAAKELLPVPETASER